MYTDEAEHGKFVGWYNMVMSVMGAIMAAVAGILAVSGWQHAFWTYYISIPVLVMLIVFLPSMKPVAKSENAESGSKEETVEAGWWKPLIPLTVQVFFIALGFFVSLYMPALYVTDAGIGDEAFIGVLSSISTIATAIMSLAFGVLYAKFKNAVYLPGVFVMGACYIVMSLFPSQMDGNRVHRAGSASCAHLLLLLLHPLHRARPRAKAGTATSIVALSDGLAATACSYLLTGCMGLMGTNAVGAWIVPGIILLATGVVSLVAYMGSKGKKNA